MLRVRSSLLMLAWLLICAPAHAQRDRDTYNPGNQTFEVSGQVNVAGTNEVVRNVPVRLERFSGGLVDQMNTDSRGRFRFTNLQRGFYKVVINAPGYGPVQQEADLTLLFKTYLVFALSRTDANGAGAPQTNLVDVIDARIPAEAREEFTQGRTALSKKSYSEAITHLQKAITIYPGFFDAQFLLATALIDQREWTKAEAALQRALEIKPEHPATMIAMGEVYWRQKRFEDAEQTLLAGLKLDDKSWHGYFTLGRLYWEKGDVNRAAPAVGRTLQLKPDLPEAHLLAGNILLKVNQQERALVEYQEYLRLAPKGEFAPQAQDLVQKLQRNLVQKP